MFKETYTVVGVMSGTSLDGIDLARITFTQKNQKWTFEIGENETVPYPIHWLNKLNSCNSMRNIPII
jgi:anhydro-N-acetylmuramic acid kinase